MGPKKKDQAGQRRQGPGGETQTTGGGQEQRTTLLLLPLAPPTGRGWIGLSFPLLLRGVAVVVELTTPLAAHLLPAPLLPFSAPLSLSPRSAPLPCPPARPPTLSQPRLASPPPPPAAADRGTGPPALATASRAVWIWGFPLSLGLIRGEGARGAGGWAGAEGVADPRAAAGEGVDLAGAAAPRAGFRLLLVGALRPRPRWGSDWLLCAGGVGKGDFLVAKMGRGCLNPRFRWQEWGLKAVRK